MATLPELLRAATRELHGRAERAGVMGELLRGRLSRAGYVALLRNLHALYAALEARALPVAPPHRAAALASDLDILHGPGWAEALAPAIAMAEYVQRVAQATTPTLAAHVYVRYLGDLHGGQVVATLARRLYGLPEGEGTRFYDFGDEAEVQRLRSGLRAGLAGLHLGVGEIEQAVAEARWAFEQHVRLFEELHAPG